MHAVKGGIGEIKAAYTDDAFTGITGAKAAVALGGICSAHPVIDVKCLVATQQVEVPSARTSTLLLEHELHEICMNWDVHHPCAYLAASQEPSLRAEW